MKYFVNSTFKYTIYKTLYILAILFIIFSFPPQANVFADTSDDISPNLILEENDSFYKVDILLDSAVDTISPSFAGSWLILDLPEDVIETIIPNFEEARDDVFIEPTRKSNKLYILAPYDNNFIYKSYSNSKKLTILAAKSEDPYNYTVTVDAGHGGKDAGTNIGDLYEKNVTLNIALMTEPYMRYEGINVIQTRTEDVALGYNKAADLEARAYIANKNDSDAFISIHVNSNPSASCTGITLYHYPSKEEETSGRQDLAAHLKTAFDENQDWWKIQTRQDNFAVIRKSTMPAALIECGFITNANDRSKLQNLNVLDGTAKSIAEGTLSFLESLPDESQNESDT